MEQGQDKGRIKVNEIFNRLRARLFNMVEQMGLDEKPCKSYKQTIRDITSGAWNDITAMFEKKEEE